MTRRQKSSGLNLVENTVLMELAACNRREAIELLATGQTQEAIQTLTDAPNHYQSMLSLGINFSDLCTLQQMLAELKVFVDALVQTGITENIHIARLIQAAAAAAAEHGGEVAAGQQEQGQQAQQELQEEQEQEQEGKEENGEENQHAVMAAAGMSAMGVDETKDQQDEEEEEEGECSVGLNAIESNDAANPAGPPLVCGHRYHATFLHYWVERSTVKCIEPTCPYCRSPLQEMGCI